MAIHEFKCTNEECEHVFSETIPLDAEEKDRLEKVCPECGSLAKRTWGIGAVYVKTIGGMARRKIAGGGKR